MVATFRQPFDLLAETMRAARRVTEETAKWRNLRFGWGTWIRTKINLIDLNQSEALVDVSLKFQGFHPDANHQYETFQRR